MVNVGLLGDVSAGKTSLLRNFIAYVNEKQIDKIDGGNACSITVADFSGEAIINEGKEEIGKETKTIHPNRVVFKDHDTGHNHTMFAPGGDRTRAVVRMGIITISRIAKQIVTVFSLDRSMEEQFKFYDSIRYFPKQVYLCFNKYDLLKDKKLDSEAEKLEFEKIKEEVLQYFRKRSIFIRNTFYTCAESNKKYKSLNDNAASMLLKIAQENVEAPKKSKDSDKPALAEA